MLRKVLQDDGRIDPDELRSIKSHASSRNGGFWREAYCDPEDYLIGYAQAFVPLGQTAGATHAPRLRNMIKGPLWSG